MIPFTVRYWAKVRKTKTCWLWQGSCNTSKYGQFYFENKMATAHRVSWAMHFGSIPEGKHVLHRCDVKLCIRPTHLWLGTHIDNMKDMAEKGRAKYMRGAQHGNSKLKLNQVLKIKMSTGKSLRWLADKYGVSFGHISKIKKGSRWTYAKTLAASGQNGGAFKGQ